MIIEITLTLNDLAYQVMKNSVLFEEFEIEIMQGKIEKIGEFTKITFQIPEEKSGMIQDFMDMMNQSGHFQAFPPLSMN